MILLLPPSLNLTTTTAPNTNSPPLYNPLSSSGFSPKPEKIQSLSKTMDAHLGKSDDHYYQQIPTLLPPPSFNVPPPSHEPAMLMPTNQLGYPSQWEGNNINNWAGMQERRAVDALRTKLARTRRKLARQRSLFAKACSSSSSSGNIASHVHHGGSSVSAHNTQGKGEHEKAKFDFCTPDNKRLRLLLKKVLRKSDVGSLGRIVLPKRETEENLPHLREKEGMQLLVRDVFSSREWVLKFKFWANNKSRMYVLENTGEFVRQNGMESGDTLCLYEDEGKNIYYTTQQAIRPEEPVVAQQPSSGIPILDDSQRGYYQYQPYPARVDEEDASLALLIEQLKDREQMEEEEARSLLGLSYPTAVCTNQYVYDPQYQAAATQPPVNTQQEPAQIQRDFGSFL